MKTKNNNGNNETKKQGVIFDIKYMLLRKASDKVQYKNYMHSLEK